MSYAPARPHTRTIIPPHTVTLSRARTHTHTQTPNTHTHTQHRRKGSKSAANANASSAPSPSPWPNQPQQNGAPAQFPPTSTNNMRPDTPMGTHNSGMYGPPVPNNNNSVGPYMGAYNGQGGPPPPPYAQQQGQHPQAMRMWSAGYSDAGGQQWGNPGPYGRPPHVCSVYCITPTPSWR